MFHKSGFRPEPLSDIKRGARETHIALKLPRKSDTPEISDYRYQQVQNMPEIGPQLSAMVLKRWV